MTAGRWTAEQVLQLRESLGLSQERFGRLLGVSFMTVNRWEKSHFSPSYLAVDKLNKLQKKLGLR